MSLKSCLTPSYAEQQVLLERGKLRMGHNLFKMVDDAGEVRSGSVFITLLVGPPHGSAGEHAPGTLVLLIDRHQGTLPSPYVLHLPWLFLINLTKFHNFKKRSLTSYCMGKNRIQ